MSSTMMISATRSLNPAAVRRLRDEMTGSVTTPGDPGYDDARRVWNGMIDRFPALIVHCANTNDVIAAIAFARNADLPIAVRGGGHHVAGFATCDGGLVIDLSSMNQVRVDPEARIAHAEGGALWSDVDSATQEYGLATPGGVFSKTGIAGLTLGGGLGWLRSTYGLSCDNLIAAEVVLANGDVVVADETGKHSDLLWGLRGGGGNFGVVTRFTYRLHPVGPQVFFVFVLHEGEGEKMERGLRFYRDFCASAPDEANTIAVCGKVPAEEPYPESLHGRPFFLLGGLYVGSVEDGERILQPLRDLGEPMLDYSGVMRYVDVQQVWDTEYPDGRRYYWKSVNLSQMDDEVIARIATHAHAQPSDLSTTDLWHNGGAVQNADAASASAYNGRNNSMLLNFEANWDDPADDAANIEWARNAVADFSEFTDGSRYLNFAGVQEVGEQLVRSGFGPNYARLVLLKQLYDPANLFHLNQNIDPATI